MAKDKDYKPRYKAHDIKDEDYRMFVNGKFNPNAPRAFNWLIGFNERDTSKSF